MSSEAYGKNVVKRNGFVFCVLHQLVVVADNYGMADDTRMLSNLNLKRVKILMIFNLVIWVDIQHPQNPEQGWQYVSVWSGTRKMHINKGF